MKRFMLGFAFGVAASIAAWVATDDPLAYDCRQRVRS
jgi:hypothetical protein